MKFFDRNGFEIFEFLYCLFKICFKDFNLLEKLMVVELRGNSFGRHCLETSPKVTNTSL